MNTTTLIFGFDLRTTKEKNNKINVERGNWNVAFWDVLARGTSNNKMIKEDVVYIGTEFVCSPEPPSDHPVTPTFGPTAKDVHVKTCLVFTQGKQIIQ